MQHDFSDDPILGIHCMPGLVLLMSVLGVVWHEDLVRTQVEDPGTGWEWALFWVGQLLPH